MVDSQPRPQRVIYDSPDWEIIFCLFALRAATGQRLVYKLYIEARNLHSYEICPIRKYLNSIPSQARILTLNFLPKKDALLAKASSHQKFSSRTTTRLQLELSARFGFRSASLFDYLIGLDYGPSPCTGSVQIWDATRLAL